MRREKIRMEKRKLEKLGVETSLLGYGCMRFPVTADGKIDEAEAEKLLDTALAAGVWVATRHLPFQIQRRRACGDMEEATV